MPGGSPSSQRRKLKAELQKARSAAGLTQRDAAQQLDWSASKLIRVENGEVSLSVTDLRAMLQLYGVTDEHAVADLSDAARRSKGSFWWSAFRDVVSPKFALYLGQEASASAIHVFHPFLIPGLLHTEEYAFELLRVHCTDQGARRIVEMRLQRQQSLLGHTDSPEVIFVFGEEALHRWIGSPAVMRRQLQHLLNVSEQTGVSIEVIPFSAGAHPGLLGSFILLDFEDPAEHLVFVEGLSGNLISRDDEDKVSQFTRHFEAIRQLALPSTRSKGLIEQVFEKFGRAEESSHGTATRPLAESLSSPISAVSKSADAGEGGWGSLSDGAESLPPRLPRAPARSLSFSTRPLATGAAPCASSRSSAAYFSSLSSASL